MDLLSQLGVFALQTLFIVVAIVVVLIVFFSLLSKARDQKSELEIENLNEKFEHFAAALKHQLLTKKELKAEQKKLKQESKKKDKLKKTKIYVLDFNGDVKANPVQSLRDEVSSILLVASPQDEVFLRLESPGGMVHGYGLAASQLVRIREKGIPLVVSVDKVAASGGYLMVCTANKILSARFAIIGSIGVVAQVPNFHKLLKKNQIDYNEYTAGEFKRTVSMLAEITPAGEAKFKDQLEQTHTLFKNFVSKNRPQLQMEKVATGEYWYGEQALSLGLVDSLQTSDDYLLSKKNSHELIRVATLHKKKLTEKLSDFMEKSLIRIWSRLWTESEYSKLP
ncbi:MAG: protease SohB [Pseudobdellovibrionaceae bacterium]